MVWARFTDYSPAFWMKCVRRDARGVVTVGIRRCRGNRVRGHAQRNRRVRCAHPTTRGRLSRSPKYGDIDRAASEGVSRCSTYPERHATRRRCDAADVLHQLGVRLVQLTYNTRNLLGDGCLERTNAGLSTFGLAVVEGMKARRMLVDVSHSGEATSLDAIRLAGAPVAITHAGCRSIFEHPRNKSDAVLRAMADGGGVIGIYQINPYLGPNERNHIEKYIANRPCDQCAGIEPSESAAIASIASYRTLRKRNRSDRRAVRLRPVTRQISVAVLSLRANHPRRMERPSRLGSAAPAGRGYRSNHGGNFTGCSETPSGSNRCS